MVSILIKLTFLMVTFHSTRSVIVFRFFGCPSVTTKSDFDKSQYLGDWYEYQRFSNWFERNLRCGKAEYTDNPDGSIAVVNSGTDTETGEVSTANGKATVPDSSKPGELKVSFSSFDFTRGANYLVLDTDYTNFAVVFSCTSIPFFPINIQTSWILTRAQGTAPSNLNEIKALMTSFDIPIDKFNDVSQSNCAN